MEWPWQKARPQKHRDLPGGTIYYLIRLGSGARPLFRVYNMSSQPFYIPEDSHYSLIFTNSFLWNSWNITNLSKYDLKTASNPPHSQPSTCLAPYVKPSPEAYGSSLGSTLRCVLSTAFRPQRHRFSFAWQQLLQCPAQGKLLPP